MNVLLNFVRDDSWRRVLEVAAVSERGRQMRTDFLGVQYSSTVYERLLLLHTGYRFEPHGGETSSRLFST